MKKLQFSIAIDASAAKTWQILWNSDSLRDWAGIIDPGTYLVGELKEGNEIQFISSENGYGVTSFIEKMIPNQYILLKHQCDTQKVGSEKRQKEWTGGSESYALSEHDRTTTLTVEFDIPPTQEDYFLQTFPNALARIKELAEQ